ncbi:MAG: sugar ABC transporter ATP-binding protein [Rhodospirillaceae bacterium]|nr:sugar ABC transporter ATP-binding protein [Rhodospirillaceae bacterium]
MTPVLEGHGLSKSFPGVRALERVSFELAAGEIHALIGENGAGKSTLIKILTGVHQPDEGTLLLDGRPVVFASPREAIAAGISVVHQERNLIPRFSVGENIMLERLPTRHGLVDYAAVHREARHWLSVLDLDLDPRTPVTRLSVAQMQLVEIAKALSLEARILLMDEPTASITPHEADTLFALLRRLRDEGVTIVFVSHKLEEVFALCERVTVLRDGRNACPSRPLAGLDRAGLVRLMIGRDEQVARLGARARGRGSVALSLRGVATALGHRGIELDLRRGEILGLYGLVGAGRSELARAIVGDVPVTAGTVSVNGRPCVIRSVSDALHRHRIGYISEDRKQEGLILIHSIARNVAITVWRRLGGALGLLGEAAERRAVQPQTERLQVRAPSLGVPVGNLSGGNQQKVSVAKWLAAGVEILVVDEPTVGIDVQTKAYLHELVWRLAEEGTAILLISSDLPEMVALADRILVMKGFRIVGAVDNDRDYERVSHAVMDRIHAAEAVPDPAGAAAPA